MCAFVPGPVVKNSKSFWLRYAATAAIIVTEFQPLASSYLIKVRPFLKHNSVIKLAHFKHTERLWRFTGRFYLPH